MASDSKKTTPLLYVSTFTATIYKQYIRMTLPHYLPPESPLHLLDHLVNLVDNRLRLLLNQRNQVRNRVSLLQRLGNLGDILSGIRPHVDRPLILRAAKATASLRENPGAVGEVVDVVNTEQAETDVLARIVVVPVLLAAGAGESAELGVDAGVLREHNVRVELEDAGRGTAKSLLVKGNVPHARGAVLRVAEAGGVNEALLAGRVGAEEGGETKGLDGLGAEELDQGVRIREDAGKETVGAGNVAVVTANKGADAGATRDSVLVAEYRRSRGV